MEGPDERLSLVAVGAIYDNVAEAWCDLARQRTVGPPASENRCWPEGWVSLMMRPMTLTRTASVPTVEDARRVAEALPGSVLLFGSVAKNKATSRSDIDLLVIVDHLDRDDLGRLSTYLDRLDDDAYEVDTRASLVVIDWPEWKSRRRVPPRVEYEADSRGVWLRKRSPGASVQWEKMKDVRQVITDTLCHHLSNVAAHLHSAHSQLEPSSGERRLIATQEEDEYWWAVRGRLSNLNHKCHVVLEESLLALCCLIGQSYEKDSGHKLTKIFGRLPDEVQHVMLNMRPPLDWEAMEWIQKWRDVGTYKEAFRMSTTPETTEKLGWVASDVASLVNQMTGVDVGVAIYSAYTATVADLVARYVHMEAGNGEPPFLVTSELEKWVERLGRLVPWVHEALSTREWLYPGGAPPHGWKIPPAQQITNVDLPWGETWG